MTREKDPRALLDAHEARVRERMKRAGRDLRRRPQPHADALLGWVREHPRASLGLAAGTGFLLAPRRGGNAARSARRTGGRVAAFARAVLMGQLARAVPTAKASESGEVAGRGAF